MPKCGRGAGVVVADGRGDQDAVDIEQAAGRSADAGGAGRQRILGVAIMAFAHHDRGHVFQHVLGVDGVDLDLRLAGGDVFDLVGHIGFGAFAGDDDGFQPGIGGKNHLRLAGLNGDGGNERDGGCAKA